MIQDVANKNDFKYSGGKHLGTGQYESLNIRMNDAVNWKSNWLAQYQQLYWWVMPNRNAINQRFSFISEGTPLTTIIFDSTAMLSAYQRANDLQGLLMPHGRIWGNMTFNPHKVDKETVSAFQPALDDENDKIFHYLNTSNLSRIVAASNEDLNGGTACIYVESLSDEMPLVYYSIPAINVFIEHTYDDIITTSWFKRNVSGVQFLQNFPKYNGELRRMCMDNPTMQIPIMYGQVKIGQSKWLIYAVPEQDPLKPLFEMERDYNPFMIYRDRVRPGESDGRGIAIDLLPTVQDLNHAVRDHRRILAFSAQPPMFYDEGAYFNPQSIYQWAGAMIPFGPGGRETIKPLQMPASYPDVDKQIMNLQETIKTGFQVDPLGDINTPVRTATEIAVREQRAQRTSITSIGRLENELPKQIYEVSTKILMERKLVNLTKYDKSLINFEFESPLKQIDSEKQLNNLMSNLNIKQQYFGEGAVLASANIGKMSQFLTKAGNLPADLFKSGEEIDAALAQMMKSQQPQLPTPEAAAVPIPSIDPTQMERTNISVKG